MSVGANVAMTSEAAGRKGGTLTWLSAARSDQRGVLSPFGRASGPLASDTLARATAEARIALKEAVDAAVVAAQRARSVSAALDEALAGLAAAEDAPASRLPRAAEPAVRAGSLSPREREVLALVAEGRSNKAIADQLFVSPNTIKTHVASLLNKLHADTRVQLAVIAARQLAM